MDEKSARLLEVVNQFAGKTRMARREATLDSSLERDLGLDSLSRVELWLRIERAFGVKLPEQSLSSAESVRDLLLALDSAAPGESIAAEAVDLNQDSDIRGVPEQARTLGEALVWHVERHPDRTHIALVDAASESKLSYRELLSGALRVAAGLIGLELAPGQTVAIMLPTGVDYFFSFFGVLLARAIPVPIYPPFRPSQLAEHLRRNGGILKNAEAVFLIAERDAVGVAKLLGMQLENFRGVLTVDELAGSGQAAAAATAGDVALLQYTSGSTGDPKGVVLSHANLLANIRAMGQAAQVDSNDVFVSWLPLYHDMGLIGAWLGSLYHGCPLVLMPPQSFLARPARWLWAMHRYHGTLSAAPNFGYELCLKKIDDQEIDGLDLSTVRRLFNGAEPVSADTLHRFAGRFERYGLQPRALAPVYGLAESTVGLAFAPAGRGPLIDRIERETFLKSGRADPAPAGADALSVVSCGLPLPGHQIRVVDDSGRELGERMQGRLEFKGPSASSGYFGNPSQTRALFHGDWLDSGDYAYLAAGEIYVTGRIKDLIIRGGRNYYPYETEQALGNLPGVRRGCVAVFGVPDPEYGTERLVVMAETRETENLGELRGQLAGVAAEILGGPPDDIVLVAPHSLLKTSSGKIRRSACRELYLRHAPGRFGMLGLLARALLTQSRRLGTRALAAGFAAWVCCVFWLIAPLAWLSAALCPKPASAWAISRAWARLFLWLCRFDWSIEGIGELRPDRPCILAVNHSSYLDGLALVAALPGKTSCAGFYRFVAKRELLDDFISRIFLKRIGADFVERADPRQGVQDATRLQAMPEAGISLVFFPEGTFSRAPGLAAFKMGAFVSAAASRTVVIPVTIRGTRDILRDGSWFARAGSIRLIVGRAIIPDGSSWEDAVSLRDKARAEILRHCGEPDLESLR